MRIELDNGWNVEFLKNVHMYCHSLKLTKGARTFEVPCEDTSAGYVAILPYDLSMDPTEY
jgi:hypothetical protein